MDLILAEVKEDKLPDEGTKLFIFHQTFVSFKNLHLDLFIIGYNHILP